MLAGEEAAGQRVVHDHTDALVAAERQQIGLDLAVQNVVTRLDAVIPRPAEPLARSHRHRELPGRVVRAADVPHLARSDQVVERAQGLVDRSLRIGRVRLIEVDRIGPQPAEAGLAGVEDVPARQALIVGARPDPDPALGRQHEPIATPRRGGEPAADHLLGPPGRGDVRRDRVDVRRVEERHAPLDGGVHDPERRRLVALTARRSSSPGRSPTPSSPYGPSDAAA